MSAVPRSSWAEVEEVLDQTDWIELAETGFDAAIAWGVPVGCLGRSLRDDSQREIEGFEQRPNGDWAPFARSFNSEDRRRLDSGVNAYLEAAGIPDQPSGFTWFIKKSSRFGESTADKLSDLIIKRGGDAPERIRDDLSHAVAEVY